MISAKLRTWMSFVMPRTLTSPETADSAAARSEPQLTVPVSHMFPSIAVASTRGGLSREKAHLVEWLKAVAPSDELRRWYGHQPDRFVEFKRRYEAELEEPERAQTLRHLREVVQSGPVTTLWAGY